MAMEGIVQPEFIDIDETLRLRKFSADCAFALEWYQDGDTLMLVDGVAAPYDMERLMRMYRYLEARGEVYFIELKGDKGYEPIGDVSFWQQDMPIVIGKKELRGRGIGGKVIKALVERAKTLGFESLEVAEIYDYNAASQRMFEAAGFVRLEKTPKGHSYRLDLQTKESVDRI